MLIKGYPRLSAEGQREIDLENLCLIEEDLGK